MTASVPGTNVNTLTAQNLLSIDQNEQLNEIFHLYWLRNLRVIKLQVSQT